MTVALDEEDRACLEGARGPALRFAVQLVLRAAEIMGASRLILVTFAHIDSCFYAGQAHVDFAEFLSRHDARFAVPVWTNNGVVSLANTSLRPENEAPEIVAGARKLMTLYEKLGAKPTWTCAPYQLPGRPKVGEHIVVGESNAVVFYNSVIGARTNKYGDYLDVACALIGKAPFAGLHTDEGRRAQLLFHTSDIPAELKRQDIFFHLLGHHIGRVAGRRVAAIEGLNAPAREDDLKALSAAAASAGGVELWHGVGVTPECPNLEAVFAGGEIHDVTMADLAKARADLTTTRDGPLAMVALGTPHFSFTEFAELVRLLDGRKIAKGLTCLVSTSRAVRELAAAKGWIASLEASGIEIIVDTCTYYSPAVRGAKGRVMTNAAKWAYYAPGMIGVEVCFGSLAECVESAVKGEVHRMPGLWQDLD
jgi:predicted aconitase